MGVPRSVRVTHVHRGHGDSRITSIGGRMRVHRAPATRATGLERPGAPAASRMDRALFAGTEARFLAPEACIGISSYRYNLQYLSTVDDAFPKDCG